MVLLKSYCTNFMNTWWGFEHAFVNFLFLFQYWHSILVSPQRYCCLQGQNYPPQKLFLSTIRLHNSTHLQIIPDGFSFSQDDDVSNLQVPFNVCPFLSFLKWLQDFFLPVTPEFLGHTSIFFSCINQVSKVLLEVVKLSLIS